MSSRSRKQKKTANTSTTREQGQHADGHRPPQKCICCIKTCTTHHRPECTHEQKAKKDAKAKLHTMASSGHGTQPCNFISVQCSNKYWLSIVITAPSAASLLKPNTHDSCSQVCTHRFRNVGYCLHFTICTGPDMSSSRISPEQRTQGGELLYETRNKKTGRATRALNRLQIERLSGLKTGSFQTCRFFG